MSVRLASVSKPVAALATLVAAEEGVVDLDDPAGPPGSTIRHLLAHTSGLPFEGTEPIARPEHRRIYSNEGFRALATRIAERAEMPFAQYAREAVCVPLGIEPPLHRRRVEFWTKSRAFSIDKARRLLGYAPKVDLEEGVRRTVASYRELGWL